MSTKAKIQYRGKEVSVLPGHRAVLDTYKKKMLGQVVVEVEDFEGTKDVLPGSVIQLAENGEHNVAGYETANVNVQMALQEKTVTPSESLQVITPDESKEGLSKVTVEAIVTQEKTATGNGTVKADEGKYLKQVHIEVPVGAGASGTRSIDTNGKYNVKEYEFADVNVNPPLQEKAVTPTDSVQLVEPDSGAYGLSAVQVLPVPSDVLVIKANGQHSIPGKYMSAVSVDVPPPPGWVDVNGGTWDITENGTYDVTRYERAVVNVNPTLQEKSVTPGASAQEVVADNGIYGLSKVTVEAVPTEEITVTDPVKEVVASAGKFISKITVNVPTVTVYSGTSEPTDDIGEDGDIYLLLEG